MASYSARFKQNTIDFLNELRDKGKFQLNNIDITNIRELCVFLDISSQTLYAWEKKFSGLKPEKKEVSDDIIPLRVICVRESFCKAYQSKYDEGYGNCNMLGNCDDFVEYDGIDEHESESDLMRLHLRESNEVSEKDFFISAQDKKSVVKEKEIFNQCYYGWFAGMLGIKGYSNMLVPQLKIAIGNELIKQSGLIDMNKAKKNLKKNGDKL